MANKRKLFTSDMGTDSGFSDASSEYLSVVDQAEYKDMLFSSSAQSRQGVSSMFLMNHVLLQQSNSTTPTLKPRGYKSSQEVVPQSPLVLFQPVIHGGDCTYQPPTTGQFENVSLNSFSNIASHGGTEDRKHSYGGRHRRHCHDDKRNISKSSPTSHNSAEPDHFKHSTGNVDLENFSTHVSALQTPGFTSTEFSLSSNSYPSTYLEDAKQDFAYSEDAENFPEALSPSPSKRQRFCNTYNILNQSGLLGITLRTKELIRQNKRSQTQLQKLHAHTDLFLEALRSKDPQVWTKLQLTFKNNTSEE
ncbi:CLOCK-interacting pacemaker a [Trichomycterus rosablanca]|uniref:CLOCK-interacting pacemaker a n=1 Tax=Trichomycterus rosablanca TaxID=2290929 RepID=UPI002F34F642